MRSACQIVLTSLVAAGALSGCYLFHGGEAPTESSPRDAGVAADARWAMPTPRREDAGVGADAGLACPLVRGDATCLESFLVAPGRPFTLPVTFHTCGCCAQTECAVAVDPETRTIALTTTLCPDPCDCDACVTPEARCEVPPLPRGLWRVDVDGAPAFELPVEEDSGLVAPPPACATYAEVDPCGRASGSISAERWSGEASCARPRRSVGDVDVIDVFHECWGCADLQGPCYATLEERLTDDLPPGADLYVSPTRYATWCDVDCPGVCIATTRTCVVPPLVRGDTYRVFVGDRLSHSFVAGEPPAPCVRPGG